MEYVQYEQGCADCTSEAYHQYQWGFLVQVKCIISMNRILSASKAHNQVLEKGGTYFVQYTGQIFPAFDELYLLIMSVFNTTGNGMYFPS